MRTKRGGRALSSDEQEKLLAGYPKWMARIAEFAKETCLSQGDVLRLTEEMVDRQSGVIIPEGGRKKTETELDHESACDCGRNQDRKVYRPDRSEREWPNLHS